MKTYTKRDAKQFVEDLEDGYEVEHYHGYSFYQGPAVRVDEQSGLQDVIRATEVNVRWDGLGSGFIVYPLFGDEGIGDDENRDEE